MVAPLSGLISPSNPLLDSFLLTNEVLSSHNFAKGLTYADKIAFFDDIKC